MTRQGSDWAGARRQPHGADGLTDCGAVTGKLRPVTLSGLLVRLEPLQAGHVDQLAAVGLEPELWRLQPRMISSTADMRAYVQEALDEQRRAVSLPFAIVDLRSGIIIGSTRFMDIALPHRRRRAGRAQPRLRVGDRCELPQVGWPGRLFRVRKAATPATPTIAAATAIAVSTPAVNASSELLVIT